MEIKADSVDISATSAEGTARQHVNGGSVSFSGDKEFEIGFQSGYAIDILESVGKAATNWAFSDKGGPMVITTPSDLSHLMVLMPMRV